MSPEVLAHIQAERAKAQAIIAACDAVLALYPAPVVAPVPQVRPRSSPPARRELKVNDPARTSAPPVSGEPSKKARYSDAIVRFLSHHTLEPHHSADSTVIRREVAKACGVDPSKDSSFQGDVSNALQGLKAQGRVERSGNVWALVRRES
jgi:hypothetical protein